MARLAAATLAHLPPAIRRPRYDRAALAVGMAHLGVGAFHRCHQAEFTDDALEAEFGRWGIVGINLRPPRLGPMLGDQDGLYTRTLRRDADAERGAVIARLAYRGRHLRQRCGSEPRHASSRIRLVRKVE